MPVRLPGEAGTTGISGAVSAANSLVGGQAGDQVSLAGVTALSNGNYVVNSYTWANGAATQAGAVTWGNGTTGVSGLVSAANSLVGSQTNDSVGVSGVLGLLNGNYLVSSYTWANGAATQAGALTWGSGTAGISGAVSAANSLVGSQTNDRVSAQGATVLSNGNFVVSSANWANGGAAGAGAVTWGSGTTGVTGAVSSVNSLVGSHAGDFVGTVGTVTALSNGNYVVRTPTWTNGAATSAGAVTWGNGTAGVTGAVSSANSLVGSQTGDAVGNGGITVLSSGNYVIVSSSWANGAASAAGAVTWGSGTTGITGTVSAANSLVGSHTNDAGGGESIVQLSNGNYVVIDTYWANGAATRAGAVTWGSGSVGVSGAISAANSLVGTQPLDSVGNQGVLALPNGNYLVLSANWANGAVTLAGAVTLGNGATGIPGRFPPRTVLSELKQMIAWALLPSFCRTATTS